MPTSQQHWCDAIGQTIKAHDLRGAFAVCFPAYRTDLVREMAEVLRLSHFDFRAERMAPLGWSAGEVGLEELDAVIEAACAEGRGIVVQNAEALLSCKSPEHRRQWLASALAREWPQPVILPIVLFDRDLPAQATRIVRLDGDGLPEETLLLRLAGL